MDKLEINERQIGLLLEICKDLFAEYDEIKAITENSDCFIVLKKEGEEVVVNWLQLCFLEIPKRLAENSNTVDTISKQYSIYESMSKRMLNIHAVYKNIEPKHPVEYLYKIFSEI